MKTNVNSITRRNHFTTTRGELQRSKTLKDIMRALKKTPFSPYAHHARSLGKATVAWHGTSILAAMIRDEGTHHVTTSVGTNHAFAAWTRAEWETGHLGMKTARLDAFQCTDPEDIECLGLLAQKLINEWQSKGIGYVFTRLNTGDIASILALEQHGFVVIDNLLTFSLATKSRPDEDSISNVEMSPATIDDLPELRRIAKESFRFDRFHNDPLITKSTADIMHAEWIENQVRNGLADHIIVARDNGRPFGFLTCKVDRDAEKRLGVLMGTIWLVAVDQHARGNGVAREMSAAAIAWFRTQGVEHVDVSTQSINIPAARTYLGAGFEYTCCSTTLRLYLDYGERCHG